MSSMRSELADGESCDVAMRTAPLLQLILKGESRGEDPDEEVQACPYCEVEGSEWELQCSGCQADIPFCIASGKSCSAHSRLAAA